MRPKSSFIGSASVLLGLVAGVLVGTASSGQAEDVVPEIVQEDAPVDVASGLVPAIADDGTLGFVRAADLLPPSAAGATGAKDVIPVFAADGVTVIGVNTATPAHVSYVPKDAPGAR